MWATSQQHCGCCAATRCIDASASARVKCAVQVWHGRHCQSVFAGCVMLHACNKSSLKQQAARRFGNYLLRRCASAWAVTADAGASELVMHAGHVDAAAALAVASAAGSQGHHRFHRYFHAQPTRVGELRNIPTLVLGWGKLRNPPTPGNWALGRTIFCHGQHPAHLGGGIT